MKKYLVLLIAVVSFASNSAYAVYYDSIGIKLGTSVTDGYGYGGEEGAGGGSGPGITGFVSGSYVGGSAGSGGFNQTNWINYDIATTSFNPLNSNPKVTNSGASVSTLTYSANGGAFFETPGYPTAGRELDWTVWCNNGGSMSFDIGNIPFANYDVWVYDLGLM